MLTNTSLYDSLETVQVVNATIEVKLVKNEEGKPRVQIHIDGAFDKTGVDDVRKAIAAEMQRFAGVQMRGRSYPRKVVEIAGMTPISHELMEAAFDLAELEQYEVEAAEANDEAALLALVEVGL